MKKFFIIMSILLLSSGASYADHAKPQSLKLGFMPYLAPQKIIKKYQPLADYLTEELGIDVVITIAKDYKTHLEATGTDKLEISFLGGSPYVAVVDDYGFKPLLARFEYNNSPRFRSVFYTSEKSSVETLKDLKGKKVAFGSRRSTLSTQIPLYMLMSAGLSKSDFQYDFLDNQENVFISVLLGEYDAGASSEEVFDENRHMGLRAIAYSPYLSTHIFTASSTMPAELREKIKTALYSLKDKPGYKHVLQSISPTLTGFSEASDSDYNLHRAILDQVLPELEQ